MADEQGKNQPSDIARKEEAILKFWQENKIFEKSLAKTAPQGEYIFYDGPPFATGLPHYGHILASTIKDVIPRYRTMRGFRVPRRWGWDCHGLPLENLIEDELGLKVKKDIETLGIDKFNQAARRAVLRYADDWKKIIPRLGRWVDMTNDYRTMDPTYSETVWWIFKTLYDKGLIYEGYKAMQLCPRCETTLANFEVNQGYRDTTDLAVTVKFELADDPGTYVLAWTTTAWTLPGNVALAIKSDLEYVTVEAEEGKYILAKTRLMAAFKDRAYKITDEFKGQALVGKKYRPLFDYYQDPKLENFAAGWKIYPADFVTTAEGTGIVHVAPAFGEDDLALGRTEHLPFIQPVGRDGRFKSEVKDFAGQAVKPKDDPQKTDIEIIKNLAQRDLLFAKEKITHSYPFCWRCDTPLLNYAAASWFVKVTAIKNRLVAINKKISWVPEHIKEGRFGKWLEGARDWAISRARYWGAPIPVWRCRDCQDITVIGAIKELEAKLPASGNHFWVMRHGEAENNAKNIISSRPDNPHGLTDAGRAAVAKAVKKLPAEKIDLLVASDFVRTRETVEIIVKALGLKPEQVIYDERLREVNFGELDGRPVSDYREMFPRTEEKFVRPPVGGEDLNQAKRRVSQLLYEFNAKYQNKNILLVSHEYPIWLLTAGAAGLDARATAAEKDRTEDFINTGEVRPLAFTTRPHNENYELDLHRPYIDELKFSCHCGGEMIRVPEVFDCWFESGAMPYGQAHYPFENLNKFNPEKQIGWPADFIAEGLDQTRGWFYSLLVLAAALFNETAFKSVIVNGLILAADGQKMSKRLKNYPDPIYIVETYGADALRFYLLSSPVVRGENLNFSEPEVAEVYRRVILRWLNSLAFYQTYAGAAKPKAAVGKNLLDRWAATRLAQVTGTVTTALEAGELDQAAKTLDDWLNDFSNWYIRRSRERVKENGPDRAAALGALRWLLIETAKLLAPFTPFSAELAYRELRDDALPESVHLAAWPAVKKLETRAEALLASMKQTRLLASQALEARAQAGLKVRQPLATLALKEKLDESFWPLLADEVNVRKIELKPSLLAAVELDVALTPELADAGRLRDFLRQLQERRKRAGFKPGETATLRVATDAAGKSFLDRHEAEIKTGASVGSIELVPTNPGETIVLGDLTWSLTLVK